MWPFNSPWDVWQGWKVQRLEQKVKTLPSVSSTPPADSSTLLLTSYANDQLRILCMYIRELFIIARKSYFWRSMQIVYHIWHRRREATHSNVYLLWNKLAWSPPIIRGAINACGGMWTWTQNWATQEFTLQKWLREKPSCSICGAVFRPRDCTTFLRNTRTPSGCPGRTMLLKSVSDLEMNTAVVDRCVIMDNSTQLQHG